MCVASWPTCNTTHVKYHGKTSVAAIQSGQDKVNKVAPQIRL